MTPLAPVRTVAPAEPPVSLAEAKAYLGITDTADDALIGALIQAATDWIDGYDGILCRCLVTQSWRQQLAGFGDCGKILLPLKPTQSITEIRYWDAAGAAQVLATSAWLGPFPGKATDYIEAANGGAWPATAARSDAVAITFVAGYGAASAVPQAIKTAMLVLIAAWYDEHQHGAGIDSETVPGVLTQTFSDPETMPRPAAVDYLLANYRRVSFF